MGNMGGKLSKITKEEMEAYKQLTFFTEKEILDCLERFSKIVGPEILSTVDSINDDKCKVSIEHILENVDELKENPFADRLCQVKAEWAFRVFDFDDDGRLG